MDMHEARMLVRALADSAETKERRIGGRLTGVLVLCSILTVWSDYGTFLMALLFIVIGLLSLMIMMRAPDERPTDRHFRNTKRGDGL
jgi:hypothetical protein